MLNRGRWTTHPPKQKQKQKLVERLLTYCEHLNLKEWNIQAHSIQFQSFVWPKHLNNYCLCQNHIFLVVIVLDRTSNTNCLNIPASATTLSWNWCNIYGSPKMLNGHIYSVFNAISYNWWNKSAIFKSLLKDVSNSQ